MSETPVRFYTTPQLKAGTNVTITPLPTGELEISSTGEGGGGGGTANAVLYTAQTLTDAQQAQAKKNISLDKVDNTPDSEKPISTQQQAAFTATNDEVARVKQTADSAKATADAAQPAGNYATSAQFESLTQAVNGKQPAGDYATSAQLESLAQVVDGKQPVGNYALKSDIPTIPEIPVALPNPHALTINGTAYDGSEAVEVVIEGGSGEGIGEAPLDGKQYARQSGGWSQVQSGSGALPSNTDYSVVHEGELLAIDAKNDATSSLVYTERPADPHATRLWYIETTENPCYFTDVTGLEGKALKSIEYAPYNKVPVQFGINIFEPLDVMSTNQEVYKTLESVLFTITPLDGDTGKHEKTIFLLDGTDSRVTLNPEFIDTETGLPKIPTGKRLGFIGNLYYYTGSSNTLVTTFDKDTGDIRTTDIIRTVGTNFVTAEIVQTIPEYIVPIISNFNRRIEVLEQKPLSGNISLIGDSITSFEGYSDVWYYPLGDVTTVEQTWWWQAIDKLGLTLLQNTAIPGAPVTGWQSSLNGKKVWQKLNTGSINPDYILIFAGANDFTTGFEIGDYDGKTAIAEDAFLNTFSLSYAYLLKHVIEAQPKAKIYCLTLPSMGASAVSSQFPFINNKGLTTSDYNKSIRSISTMFGCAVIDLEMCGISPFNMSTYLVDKVHPNANGMVRIGEFVAGKLTV